MSGVAALRRCISIAKSFAGVRHVGGEKGTLLLDNEMHTGALVRCELTHRALLQFMMGLALLMVRSSHSRRGACQLTHLLAPGKGGGSERGGTHDEREGSLEALDARGEGFQRRPFHQRDAALHGGARRTRVSCLLDLLASCDATHLNLLAVTWSRTRLGA